VKERPASDAATAIAALILVLLIVGQACVWLITTHWHS